MTLRAKIVAAPRARVAVACAAILAIVIVAIAVFHVSRRKDQLRLGYELSRVRKQVQTESERNRSLRLEKSVLTNPERIERLARTLGMTRPLPGQVRVLRAGTPEADAQ